VPAVFCFVLRQGLQSGLELSTNLVKDFFLCGARDGTQGLVQARQVLYHSC
jgi:hypothetical protein